MWVPSLAEFSGSRYRAIASAIEADIQAGALLPGERLPPQRRLADALGVTIGTVTRGYAEAERNGWVTARVGSGTYVKSPNQVNVFSPTFPAEKTPGVIDLSLSLPPSNPLRQSLLSEALHTLSQSGAALTRGVTYQEAQGRREHREVLASWLNRLGMPLSADELLITQGGQHGISLVLTTLLRPGELMAADALTYPGAISAAQQAHLKLVGIGQDRHGMRIDQLEAPCARQPPRVVYITPDQNNPTGVCLS